jgi:hypothetical protein
MTFRPPSTARIFQLLGNTIMTRSRNVPSNCCKHQIRRSYSPTIVLLDTHPMPNMKYLGKALFSILPNSQMGQLGHRTVTNLSQGY